jgi:hypothetical protein
MIATDYPRGGIKIDHATATMQEPGFPMCRILNLRDPSWIIVHRLALTELVSARLRNTSDHMTRYACRKPTLTHTSIRRYHVALHIKTWWLYFCQQQTQNSTQGFPIWDFLLNFKPCLSLIAQVKKLGIVIALFWVNNPHHQKSVFIQNWCLCLDLFRLLSVGHDRVLE